MRRFAPFLLTTLALFLAFAPAAPDEQSDFIQKVQDKTAALTKATKDFEAVWPSSGRARRSRSAPSGESRSLGHNSSTAMRPRERATPAKETAEPK